jgi:hypothetical protein
VGVEGRPDADGLDAAVSEVDAVICDALAAQP